MPSREDPLRESIGDRFRGIEPHMTRLERVRSQVLEPAMADESRLGECDGHGIGGDHSGVDPSTFRFVEVDLMSGNDHFVRKAIAREAVDRHDVDESVVVDSDQDGRFTEEKATIRGEGKPRIGHGGKQERSSF